MHRSLLPFYYNFKEDLEITGFMGDERRKKKEMQEVKHVLLLSCND